MTANLLLLLLLAPPAARDVAPVEVPLGDEAGPEAPEAPEEPLPPEGLPPPPPPSPAAEAPPAPPPPPRVYPDRPVRWRLDALLGASATRTFDPAAWAFDRENRRLDHLDLALRADLRLGGGRLFLGGALGYRHAITRGQLPSLTTSALVREPLLHLRAALVVVDGIDAYLQAGGGPSITDLSFYGDPPAAQRSVGALVDALAGAAFYLPKRWLPRRGASRLTAGLDLGLGYAWRSAIDVRPAVQTDEEPIPTVAAPLGDVSLHGLTWRAGLFVRLM